MTDKEIQLERKLSDTKAALSKLTVENRLLKSRQKKLAVKYSKCVNLDDVVNRNYFANIKRLKISDKTTVRDFLGKIHEEVGELIESFDGMIVLTKWSLQMLHSYVFRWQNILELIWLTKWSKK